MKKGITLIAALAVVLAITSGAFAADHYLITSSGQIKGGVIDITDLSSKARTALKGQKGSKGVQPGAMGAKGDKGDTGATIGSFGPVHSAISPTTVVPRRRARGVGDDRFRPPLHRRAARRRHRLPGDSQRRVNGTFETIAGAKLPAAKTPPCSPAWRAVLDRRVDAIVPSTTPGFDYNPDAAMPARKLGRIPGGGVRLAPDANLVATSYEFDYYNNDCDGQAGATRSPVARPSARARSRTAGPQLAQHPIHLNAKGAGDGALLRFGDR